MKYIDKIPISKVQRATKIVSTGAKVGVNYLKYYGDRLIHSEDDAKKQLDMDNASDIYDGLKEMKGSALKVAQMLSMEQKLLPEAYVEKFSLSQFSVPPLSPALVNKTFKNYFGQYPNDLFDTFNAEAISGASIGQVHLALKDGKKLAVKIQYPGVAESISSDLALVKPFALKLFNLPAKDSEKYFKEIEGKLIEETNYTLELEQSIRFANNFKHLSQIVFPNYYPELSSDRVITMDFMEGIHLSEFAQNNKGNFRANQIGQTLWDFYLYQMLHLKEVHADPHPGNFMVNDQDQLVAIDFGCVKQVPEDFHEYYTQLLFPSETLSRSEFENLLTQLEVLEPKDTPETKKLLSDIFRKTIDLFTAPMQKNYFDFSDPEFFDAIANLANDLKDNKALRELNGNRGSEHFIYLNRTFFGLFSLLNLIGANNVDTQKALKNHRK